MRSVAFLLLCIIGVLAIAEVAHSQYHQQLCDAWGCSVDCFDQGLHGGCSENDVCTCNGCIYRACRKYCIQQNRVGQCDEAHCLCL